MDKFSLTNTPGLSALYRVLGCLREYRFGITINVQSNSDCGCEYVALILPL